MEYNEERIAILLATYNGERFLREQLESLLGQTYTNWICYIHDDGSNDQTVNIAREFCEKYPYHFVIINGPLCGGAKNNFMFLLSEVKEEYIAFCDQDDYWLPEKLSETYKLIKMDEDRKKPTVVFSDLKVVNENLKLISDSFFLYSGKNSSRLNYKQILIQNFVPGCTMLINRKAVDIGLKYRNIENLYMHDWWLMIICALMGKIYATNSPLILYRQHGDNSVGADKKLSTWDVLRHIWQTIFGKHREEIYKRILIPRRFAEELKNLDGISEKDRKFLDEFSNLKKKNKCARILFYIRNKLFRSNHRNFFMLFFV